MDWQRSSKGKRALIVGGWILVVLFFASQRYIYDATHGDASRFAYYLVSSAYIWGVLTPLVLLFGDRWPVDAHTWKRSLPIHMVASLALTAVGVFVEASIAWLPHQGNWAFTAALRHYFTHHVQICLLTYWGLLAAFHIYRLYDEARRRDLHAARLEAQLTEAQLTALRSQLQPHFLFNTLQAATMLIYDDPEGAEEILLALSELLRTSLQTLNQQEIPLRVEIEFLKNYAAIQRRRFGGRLRFDFKIEEEAQCCAVPSLLLQPLVENAIRHGIGIRKESDVVSIRAFLNQNRLTIEIKNRNSALDETLEKLMSRGVGLSNTIRRLERLYGSRQAFVMRNLSPRGVVVSLSIPARPLPLQITEFETQAVG
jgi:two-component system, LytTR family, sensor kinase